MRTQQSHNGYINLVDTYVVILFKEGRQQWLFADWACYGEWLLGTSNSQSNVSNASTHLVSFSAMARKADRSNATRIPIQMKSDPSHACMLAGVR